LACAVRASGADGGAAVSNRRRVPARAARGGGQDRLMPKGGAARLGPRPIGRATGPSGAWYLTRLRALGGAGEGGGNLGADGDQKAGQGI
jgi:hypothetical protein